jgi:hypothetical protein
MTCRAAACAQARRSADSKRVWRAAATAAPAAACRRPRLVALRHEPLRQKLAEVAKAHDAWRPRGWKARVKPLAPHGACGRCGAPRRQRRVQACHPARAPMSSLSAAARSASSRRFCSASRSKGCAASSASTRGMPAPCAQQRAGRACSSRQAAPRARRMRGASDTAAVRKAGQRCCAEAPWPCGGAEAPPRRADSAMRAACACTKPEPPRGCPGSVHSGPLRVRAPGTASTLSTQA